MLYLNDAQKRDIRERRGFFMKDAEIPDFNRFFSADSRFPCSIAVPGQPPFYCDFSGPINFEVAFWANENLVVGRVDLPALARGSWFESHLAQSVLSDEHDEVWYTDQREMYLARTSGRRKYRIYRKMVQVGTDRKAACIVYDDSRRVFFLDSDKKGMWNIGTESLDEQQFRKIVQTFEFLKNPFFSELQHLMNP